MAQNFAVELREVTKSFGEIIAVSQVSLQILLGEFFTLLGPSGCGKTTTLRLIAGFEEPSQGRITITGQDVTEEPAYRRNVNMVFQHYALFPHMNVEENVGYGLRQKRVLSTEIVRRVREALELVQLEGLENRRPHQLSGGQQQRVALARALINRPAVLLLDEPLGALDLKLRKEMQMELKSLQKMVGITFIYVTHDQEEALTMSDRIAVMHAGRIEQLGAPQEIYELPQTPFVADFIGLSNFIRGEVVDAQGRLNLRVSPEIVLPLPVQTGLHIGQRSTVAIRPEKIGLQSVTGNPEDGLVGQIVASTYLGDQMEYRVQVQGLGVLIVRRQNTELTEEGERRVPGDRVILSWRPESQFVL